MCWESLEVPTAWMWSSFWCGRRLATGRYNCFSVARAPILYKGRHIREEPTGTTNYQYIYISVISTIDQLCLIIILVKSILLSSRVLFCIILPAESRAAESIVVSLILLRYTMIHQSVYYKCRHPLLLL